eukprot:m.95988 g.95988  ORF g.95988 m.95988 type:complete len:144 (+) comp12450_c2_seq1:3713-4144(+)
MQHQLQQLRDSYSQAEEAKSALIKEHEGELRESRNAINQLREQYRTSQESHTRTLRQIQRSHVPKDEMENYRQQVDREAEMALKEKIQDVNHALVQDAAMREATSAHERLLFEKNLQRLQQQVVDLKRTKQQQLLLNNNSGRW